jgi:tetratricopeptide (TPR) repeat protein
MAKRRSAFTIGKWLLAAVLAVVAYPGLQYSLMLRDMDRASSVYAQGDLEGALAIYDGIESRLRAHGAMRFIPARDRQTLILNEARLLYALNRYDEAIERLQKEDEISGVATDGRFFLLRGQITFRRALEEYRKPRGPVMDASRLAQDLNLLREGLTKAEDSFRESLQINPNDWDAKYNYELASSMEKALGESVDENVKVLKEGELAPTEALPPELVG